MVNGNLSDEDMGEICGQYHEVGRKRLADESGKEHSGDKPTIKTGAETEFVQEIVERVAVARTETRHTKLTAPDDPTDFLEFFHKELEGDWTSLLEASKITAKMILDAGNDGAVNSSSETDMLATLRQPFRALWAKYQERDSTLL